MSKKVVKETKNNISWRKRCIAEGIRSKWKIRRMRTDLGVLKHSRTTPAHLPLVEKGAFPRKRGGTFWLHRERFIATLRCFNVAFIQINVFEYITRLKLVGGIVSFFKLVCIPSFCVKNDRIQASDVRKVFCNNRKQKIVIFFVLFSFYYSENI